MRVIITTGFEKITHSITFHPAAEPKGKGLAESGHVREVTEFRENGISFLIQARVIKQTKVFETTYTVELLVNSKCVMQFTFTLWSLKLIYKCFSIDK